MHTMPEHASRNIPNMCILLPILDTGQVNEVKDVMVENIEKVLERGEKIELLVDKTDDLRNQVGWGEGEGREGRRCEGRFG